MPSKKGFTSKDYQGPLRRPGEKRDTSTAEADAVGKETSSASKESEKGAKFAVLLAVTVNLYISATVVGAK